MIVHSFDWPDRFVVGAVGVPGQRAFYLQARDGQRLLSVGMEKQQASLLAEKMDEVLDELMTSGGNPFGIPAHAPDGLRDDDPLDQPVEQQFRAGAMTLGWDPTTAQVVVEAFSIVDIDEDEETAAYGDMPEPDEMLTVRIPVGSARAFVQRTRSVVAQGRPVCPYCGDPMDPAGHSCNSSSAPWS